MTDLEDLLEPIEGIQGDPDPSQDVSPPAVGVHGSDNGMDKVDRFFDKMADIAEEGGVVGVERTVGGKPKRYLGEVAASILTIGWMQTNMGGGKYKLAARDGVHNKYAAGLTFEIEGKPLPWPPPEDEEEDGGIKELRTMVEALQGKQGGGSMEMLQMMLAMMTAVSQQTKPLMEAVLARGQPERTTASELKDLLELVEKMGPKPAGEGDPFDRIVTPLIPAVTKILNQAGDMAPNPPQTRPQPQPAPAQAPPAPPPGSEWVELFRPHLPQLQTWAASNKSPKTLADFVVMTLEDHPSLPMILEQLGRDEQFLIEFFIFFPQTKPLEAWYREFWHEFAAYFKWEDAADSDDPEDPEVSILQAGPEKEAGEDIQLGAPNVPPDD